MTEYAFTLKFRLPCMDTEPETYLGQLREAGCEDALVGVGKRGRIALSFNRQADSAHSAVLSAVSDVRRAIPDASLAEATPDFVSLTDAAEVLGFSRQNMRQLVFSCEADAPVPIHEGRPSLWHLADLLRWLRERKDYPIRDDLLELAETNRQINIAVTAHGAERSVQRKIRSLLT